MINIEIRNIYHQLILFSLATTYINVIPTGLPETILYEAKLHPVPVCYSSLHMTVAQTRTD